MRKLTLSFLAIVSIAILTVSVSADVKVKSRQSMSGQSYESTTYIKGKRQRTESIGGMVTLTQCDLRRGVQINSSTKTYMVNPFAETVQTSTRPGSAAVDKNGVIQTGGIVTTTITTKDTGERKQMFGYTARRLIITIETVSSPDACSKADSKMQTDGWYIDAAFALDCDYGAGGYASNYGTKAGCKDKFSVKTIGTARRGFPVYEKTTMFDASGKESFSMVNEVIEFSQATLDTALFDVPQGYREVSDASQMYAGAGQSYSAPDQGESGSLRSSVTSAAKTPPAAATTLSPKKPGVIRVGVPTVKTGTVGDGIPASDLAQAVRNTLMQNLKSPKIEVVTLGSGTLASVQSEAAKKECDFVAYVTVSHKKGGGGFGMFKSLAPVLSSVVPGSADNAGGYIASTAASTTITAASVSGQMKNKDELTLDLKLEKHGTQTPVTEKVVKAKAKSNGEDIITQAVIQAAQSILAVVG